MNANSFFRIFAAPLAGACLLGLGATAALGQSEPLYVGFWIPTNGASYAAPANIGLHAQVSDSIVVDTVQYFAGSNSIGIATNAGGVLLTNLTTNSPFYLTWAGVPAGHYALTAVATDSAGNSATSAPVIITVTGVTNSPPPQTNAPPSALYALNILTPTNGQRFSAPAAMQILALAIDSNGVQAVQFFANSNSLGIATDLTNNQFSVMWSNVAAGDYTLSAVATDRVGNALTSAPVNITVTGATNGPPPGTNAPPVAPYSISILAPANGQTFPASTTVEVVAQVSDSNQVTMVQFFAGTNSLGNATYVTNTQFYLLWSNVPPGNYTLTAVATDGLSSNTIAVIRFTSDPVNITVTGTNNNTPPVESNQPPALVSIYATDPVAVAGPNYSNSFIPPPWVFNYCAGASSATFLVRRQGVTNADLNVYYSISGTASNGVQYATIPDYVTIPTAQEYALIVIRPLLQEAPLPTLYDVVLTLTAPTNVPPSYTVGLPSKAGAIILEGRLLPIVPPKVWRLGDGCIYLSMPATNGMTFCLQSSSNLVNWQSICTNIVLKGSAQFVDPNNGPGPGLFYRITPSLPPTY